MFKCLLLLITYVMNAKDEGKWFESHLKLSFPAFNN